MVATTFILALLGLATTVYSTSFTTLLTPNERLCFYADVDKAGEKLGVRSLLPSTVFTHLTRVSFLKFYFAVQSGGSFDVDFELKDPNDKVILDGQRERQGDYVLTANTVGEYSFCFENDMSTLTDKLVDIDIMVESEPRLEAPAKAGQIQEQTSALEESIYRMNSLFMSIKRTQK